MKTLIVIFMLGFPFFSLGQNLVGDKKDLIVTYCEARGYTKISEGLCNKYYKDSLRYSDGVDFDITYFFDFFGQCLKTIIQHKNSIENAIIFKSVIQMWKDKEDAEVTEAKEGYTRLKQSDYVVFIKAVKDKVITLHTDAYVKEVFLNNK